VLTPHRSAPLFVLLSLVFAGLAPAPVFLAQADYSESIRRQIKQIFGPLQTTLGGPS
jgi:hypothetical protein